MDEQTTPQPSGDDQSPQANETGLRELALALIGSSYPGIEGDVNGTEPQLLPGQTPSGFLDDVPLAPGSRVVGSLITNEATVVLDTEQQPEDVLAFYREQLPLAGWIAQEEPWRRHGGFLHSGMSERQSGNFYREDGPSLTIMAHPTYRGITSVRLNLTPGGGVAMRGADERIRRTNHEIWNILPPIASPPHSEQFQEGGSGGDDRVSASARVESDLDLAALAAHYSAQLERGGWQRHASGESAPVAWSTWTFEDEQEEKQPWRALFVIVKWPGEPRRCWVQLLAEWTGTQPKDGVQVRGALLGWQSHTQMRRRS